MELKIEGGLLYVDGIEASVKESDGVVYGSVGDKKLTVSAGQVYMDGDFVGSIKYEQFAAWRETL